MQETAELNLSIVSSVPRLFGRKRVVRTLFTPEVPVAIADINPDGEPEEQRIISREGSDWRVETFVGGKRIDTKTVSTRDIGKENLWVYSGGRYGRLVPEGPTSSVPAQQRRRRLTLRKPARGR